MTFQILHDDDEGDFRRETLEFTIRITGDTDDIGRFLDHLQESTTPRVEFDPPGWTRTFYGWEKDIWET